MPSTISELFNHFMQLIGLKYYTKNESDNKYALKSEIPSSSTVDDSLSASSENPVQNKVIKNALDGKSDNGHTHNQYLTSHQDISGKVNVGDIKDNLTSTDTDKPLSANQGKVLKGLVDGKASSNHSHNTGEVSDTSAYTNIGSSANATQKTINDKINSALGSKANSNNVYSKSETYTQSEITTLISNAVSDLQLFEVVSNLPTSNIKTNQLYLIVNDETITNNKYDIYLRVNDSWEQLDSLEFDISNYYKKSEIDTLLNGKVDTSDSRLTNARTPTSHSHGDITNTGTIGSTANKPLITTTNGKIATGSFGTTANTFCQGNDSRLSDARTPTAHTHTKSEISDFPTSMTPTSHTHTKSEITDFPSTMTPTSHTHGNLQNGGTISVSGTVQKSKNVVTDSNGYITTEAKPTIPTKTSQLTNDSGYLTSHQDITGKLDKAQGSTNASKNVVTDANGNITVEAKPTIPSANTTASNIKMNGTQSAGSLTSFAKADHIHPTDTSRVAVSQGTSNSGKFLKVNSSGNVACESVTIPSAYTHPSYTSKSNGLYKITVDGTGHVSATASVSASDIPTLTSSKISDLNSVIADAVGSLELFEVVTTLPTSNISNKKLYLVPNSINGTTNKYDIYLRVNNAWEKIDSLDFNITDYIKKTTGNTNLLLANGSNIAQSTFATSSHAHGNISNDGKIGSASGVPIITGTSGVLQAGSFGTTAGTFCQGNDSRLSDSRTPTSHASTSATYGAASTTNYGHVKLSTSTSSTSTTLAATPSAVKSAYDRASTALTTANGKLGTATYSNGTLTIS